LTRGHVTGLNEPKLNFFFHFSLFVSFSCSSSNVCISRPPACARHQKCLHVYLPLLFLSLLVIMLIFCGHQIDDDTVSL
ncbi:hypothetical protein T09_10994, partial [Trichinella sp. T9]